MTVCLTIPEIPAISYTAVKGSRRIVDEGGRGGRHRTVSCCSRNRIRVSDPIRSAVFNPIFLDSVLRVSSVFPQPPSLRQQQHSGGDDDKHDYYVNLGHAIRALREDYPVVFYKEPDFSIYRDDIVFTDPLNTFIGIDNYKRLVSGLQLLGPVLFKALWIDLVSILQPAESTIMIRWTVHGVPRVPWESNGRFDGVSVYKLDRKGKIYEHRVDNVARNAPTRLRVMGVEELVQSLGCPSPTEPTCFETSLSSVADYVPFVFGVFVWWVLFGDVLNTFQVLVSGKFRVYLLVMLEHDFVNSELLECSAI